MTSDRRLDSYDNPSKTSYRERNLDFLRRASYQLWKDPDGPTRLRCDWCELLGATGRLSYQLLAQEGVLAPQQFLGVDLSRDIVARHSELGIRTECGNLHDILPRHEEIGVLNFDGYYAVDSNRLRADIWGVRAAAERSLRRYQEFCLFLNCDLDAASRTREPGTMAGLMRSHARMIATAFDGVPAYSRLDDDMLLPAGDEHRIADGELGEFGYFEVYRGRKGGHRMVNLRLLLG